MTTQEDELQTFIADEKLKACMGSGDDGFYAGQVEEYILKQKRFWLDAIKTFKEKGKLEAFVQIRKLWEESMSANDFMCKLNELEKGV